MNLALLTNLFALVILLGTILALVFALVVMFMILQDIRKHDE